jgi:hypothetical protein
MADLPRQSSAIAITIRCVSMDGLKPTNEQMATQSTTSFMGPSWKPKSEEKSQVAKLLESVTAGRLRARITNQRVGTYPRDLVPGDCAHAHGAAHMRAALHSREIQMAKQDVIDRELTAMLPVGASD